MKNSFKKLFGNISEYLDDYKLYTNSLIFEKITCFR